MSTKSESKKITKKDLISLFWRAFLLPACYSMDRMQAPGFAYSIIPVLKKLYGDDKEKLAEACSRHSEVYNNTFACSHLFLGIVGAMEEEACANPNFDVNSINAIKVALMGPLSGIGDTFFWGIIRILACALAVGFAKEGNVIAPFILLLVFNIPNFATRWITLFLGYEKGSALLSDMQSSGKMQLFTHCAGIIGAMSIGCMIAMWVSISCPLQFTLAGSEIVIQEYLDQILPKMLPLVFTLGIFSFIKKKYKVQKIIAGIVVVGFVLGILGLVSM